MQASDLFLSKAPDPCKRQQSYQSKNSEKPKEKHCIKRSNVKVPNIMKVGYQTNLKSNLIWWDIFFIYKHGKQNHLQEIRKAEVEIEFLKAEAVFS